MRALAGILAVALISISSASSVSPPELAFCEGRSCDPCSAVDTSVCATEQPSSPSPRMPARILVEDVFIVAPGTPVASAPSSSPQDCWLECPTASEDEDASIVDELLADILMASQSENVPDPVKVLQDPSCDMTQPLYWGIVGGEGRLWSDSCDSQVPVGPTVAQNINALPIPGDNDHDGQADYVQEQLIDVVLDADGSDRQSREAADPFRGDEGGNGVTVLVGDDQFNTFGEYSAIVRFGDVEGTDRLEIVVVQSREEVTCAYTLGEDPTIHVTKAYTTWTGRDDGVRDCGDEYATILADESMMTAEESLEPVLG